MPTATRILGPSATPGMVKVQTDDGSIIDMPEAQAMASISPATPAVNARTSMAEDFSMANPAQVAAQPPGGLQEAFAGYPAMVEALQAMPGSQGPQTAQLLPQEDPTSSPDGSMVDWPIVPEAPRQLRTPVTQSVKPPMETQNFSEDTRTFTDATPPPEPMSTPPAPQPDQGIDVIGGIQAFFGGQDVTDTQEATPGAPPATGGGLASLQETRRPNPAGVFGGTLVDPGTDLPRTAANVALQLNTQAMMGTPGNPRLRAYLQEQLRGLGVESEDIQDKITTLFSEMLGLHQQGGDIAASEAEKTAAALRAYDRQLAASEQRRALEEHAINQEVRSRIQEFDTMLQNARTMRLDPNRIFAGNGAARAGAAISMGVGAAIQTVQNIMFPGSSPQNVAMQIINRAVDQDIAAQVENYQRNVQDLDAQQSLIGILRQRLGDNEAATEAARITMRTQVLNQLQAIAASAQSEQVRNHVLQLINSLQTQWYAQEAAVRQGQAEQIQAAIRRTHGSSPTFSQRTSFATAASNIENTRADNLAAATQASGGEPFTFQGLRVTDPATLQARQGQMTAPAFREALGQVTSARTVQSFVRRMRSIMRRHDDGQIGWADAHRLAESLVDEAMTEQNLSKLSETDRDFFARRFSNPYAAGELIRIGDYGAQLDEMSRRAQQNGEEAARSLGQQYDAGGAVSHGAVGQ